MTTTKTNNTSKFWTMIRERYGAPVAAIVRSHGKLERPTHVVHTNVYPLVSFEDHTIWSLDASGQPIQVDNPGWPFAEMATVTFTEKYSGSLPDRVINVRVPEQDTQEEEIRLAVQLRWGSSAYWNRSYDRAIWSKFFGADPAVQETSRTNRVSVSVSYDHE